MKYLQTFEKYSIHNNWHNFVNFLIDLIGKETYNSLDLDYLEDEDEDDVGYNYFSKRGKMTISNKEVSDSDRNYEILSKLPFNVTQDMDVDEDGGDNSDEYEEITIYIIEIDFIFSDNKIQKWIFENRPECVGVLLDNILTLDDLSDEIKTKYSDIIESNELGLL